MPFEILTVDQLIQRLKGKKYRYSQVHHTYKPDHSDFNGKNHIQLQQAMRNYHVNQRGWSDIGQHVTLFPDGLFVTGRDFDKTPAGINGYNTGAFMTEMLGNFDKGHDKLEGKQLESMLKLQHFLVTECGAEIIFHREHAKKTCPGTGIDKGEFLSMVASYKPEKVIDRNEQVKSQVVKKIPYPGFLIKRGSKGKYVEMVQKVIGVKVDGIFGPKTEAAVKAFQRKNGLKPDGIVGPKTFTKMF
jgi:peptidoglycan hydrolase-like protein with peptidoglycan-binding domain